MGGSTPGGMNAARGRGWQPVQVLNPAMGRWTGWDFFRTHRLYPTALPPMSEGLLPAGVVRHVDAAGGTLEQRCAAVVRAERLPGCRPGVLAGAGRWQGIGDCPRRDKPARDPGIGGLLHRLPRAGRRGRQRRHGRRAVGRIAAPETGFLRLAQGQPFRDRGQVFRRPGRPLHPGRRAQDAPAAVLDGRALCRDLSPGAGGAHPGGEPALRRTALPVGNAQLVCLLGPAPG